jgi:hypothetical protein
MKHKAIIADPWNQSSADFVQGTPKCSCGWKGDLDFLSRAFRQIQEHLNSHDGSIKKSGSSAKKIKFRPNCSCGWKGWLYVDKDMAERALSDHYVGKGK